MPSAAGEAQLFMGQLTCDQGMHMHQTSSATVIRMNSPIKWDTQAETLLDDPELEQLLLRLHACADFPEFWNAMRAILDALIPSDASLMYVNFQNFKKSWEAARIFVTPKADKPVGWMQKRRMVDIMPPFMLDHPGMPLFRLSDVCPAPCELENTEFFRRYMEPDGWRYSTSLLFWQGSGLHSEITIRRRETQGDFTQAEVAALTRLRPHFSTVLNRLLKASRSTSEPGLLKLEGGNLVRTLEPAPRKSAAANDPLRGGIPVPRLLSEAGLERNKEESLQIRVVFSDKERAVLRLAAAGVSNEEISRVLGVTTHTVKWHLANVYVKLGVKNRTAAVRAALAMELV